MCQVHTGAYVSLLASVKTVYTASHPRKITTYILHVVSVRTTDASQLEKRNKENGKEFRGSTGESATRTGCHVFFRRSTAVLRTTSDTPTEARTTGQLRDRQLAVVVTCLCVGGPCALPLVRSCLSKTCGVLDGLRAAAHQNVRSYDLSFLQEM